MDAVIVGVDVIHVIAGAFDVKAKTLTNTPQTGTSPVPNIATSDGKYTVSYWSGRRPTRAVIARKDLIKRLRAADLLADEVLWARDAGARQGDECHRAATIDRGDAAQRFARRCAPE